MAKKNSATSTKFKKTSRTEKRNRYVVKSGLRAGVGSAVDGAIVAWIDGGHRND